MIIKQARIKKEIAERMPNGLFVEADIEDMLKQCEMMPDSIAQDDDSTVPVTATISFFFHGAIMAAGVGLEPEPSYSVAHRVAVETEMNEAAKEAMFFAVGQFIKQVTGSTDDEARVQVGLIKRNDEVSVLYNFRMDDEAAKAAIEYFKKITEKEPMFIPAVSFFGQTSTKFTNDSEEAITAFTSGASAYIKEKVNDFSFQLMSSELKLAAQDFNRNAIEILTASHIADDEEKQKLHIIEYQNISKFLGAVHSMSSWFVNAGGLNKNEIEANALEFSIDFKQRYGKPTEQTDSVRE